MQKSTLLSVVLVFLLAVLPTEVRSAEAVEFADAALQHAVADALGLEPGAVVTREGLLQLESLRVRDAGITSLSGLEWARNLTELDVRGNDVRDLAPLSGLVRLEWLSLRENRALRDVGPLADLAELHYLNLNRNHLVKSIVPLAGLVNLETLILRGVGVLGREEEQQVLAGLENLERLNVRDTGLDSLSVIEDGLEDGRYEEQLDLRENPVRIGQDLVPFSPHIEELQYSRPEFSGRARLEGATVYAFRDREYHPRYDMDVRLRFDAEPRSFVRVFGALDIELDDETMEFGFNIDEVFVQYQAADWLRFRAGKQKMSWGQARLFGNPGDFMGDVDDGAALRSDVAGFGSRLTMVMYAEGSFFDPEEFSETGHPMFGQFGYAARLRGAVVPAGWLRYGLAGWLHRPSFMPLRTSGYVSVGGDLSLTMEAVAYWLRDGSMEGDGFITSTLDWQAGEWRLTGEYRYDSRDEEDGLRFFGAAVESPRWAGWLLSAEWLHGVSDGAGSFVPRVERELLPYVDAVLRLPIRYGEDSEADTVEFRTELAVSF